MGMPTPWRVPKTNIKNQVGITPSCFENYHSIPKQVSPRLGVHILCQN